MIEKIYVKCAIHKFLKCMNYFLMAISFMINADKVFFVTFYKMRLSKVSLTGHYYIL